MFSLELNIQFAVMFSLQKKMFSLKLDNWTNDVCNSEFEN